MSQAGYRGARMVVGSKHGKAGQIAPPFRSVLGAEVFGVDDMDTDRYGTFTGEVPRVLTPRDAAVSKARDAMAMAGVAFGLASEATYTMRYGVLPWHEEILVFVDDVRGIEVTESEAGVSAAGQAERVTSADMAVDAARRFGFPRQAAVIRACDDTMTHTVILEKGLTRAPTLRDVVRRALCANAAHDIWIEPDLRAHHNPSRRVVIERLARRLAARLATTCPACHSPGYGRVAVRQGMPCGTCGGPTGQIATDLLGCPACDQTSSVRRSGTADPRWCPTCNP